MHKRIYTLALTAAVLVSLPGMAHAYLNPYDVLLSNDLLLPANRRDAADRVARQQQESAARRDAEQAAIFADQHAVQESQEFDGMGELQLHGAAPEAAPGDSVSPEFSALMRTLERISDTQARARAEAELRQQAFLLLEEQGISLHGGAPLLQGKGKGLPPTGAGTIAALAALLLGAVWTLRRARKAAAATRV